MKKVKCINGHDTSDGQSRYKNGMCKQCQKDINTKLTTRPIAELRLVKFTCKWGHPRNYETITKGGNCSFCRRLYQREYQATRKMGQVIFEFVAREEAMLPEEMTTPTTRTGRPE